MRTSVFGQDQTAPASGLSCFRSVVDASKLHGLQDTEWFTQGLSGMRGVLFQEGNYRIIVMYPCRSGSLINLVALYTDPHQDDPGQQIFMRI
jgi:salicylate hydroxylase